ncbi:hypothetical protein CTI12_AA538950 [Artemisia annua]|uniref:Uncharacterized protein n=1 Tax=Artemisia annua TaxID=35608 RepID=A0A2U1L274_ARTAN|nr:hypothetical protein CTI12_AA538950 [Artemisia annua]
MAYSQRGGWHYWQRPSGENAAGAKRGRRTSDRKKVKTPDTDQGNPQVIFLVRGTERKTCGLKIRGSISSKGDGSAALG